VLRAEARNLCDHGACWSCEVGTNETSKVLDTLLLEAITNRVVE